MNKFEYPNSILMLAIIQIIGLLLMALSIYYTVIGDDIKGTKLLVLGFLLLLNKLMLQIQNKLASIEWQLDRM